MRIAQVILPNASEYERKSQRLDRAALAPKHEVIVVEPHAVPDTATAVVHFYGNDLPPKLVTGIRSPYIASVEPHVSRFRLGFKRPPQPRYVVSPIAPIDPDGRMQLLPEAVEQAFFDPSPARAGEGGAERRVRAIGVYANKRHDVRNLIEQTLARLDRSRDDIQWSVFDVAPTPADLRSVDVWVDPATSDSDFDGFVAEAIAAGKAVVASRTPINSLRLEKGRTGFLVPPSDPNELSHAILAALFKSEVASLKIEAARQTAGKFRPRQRLRVLERIYETLVQ